MPEAINIGLDFGSLGWRSAFARDDRITALSLEGGVNGPGRLLTCEPSRKSSLGVHFPSVKSELGMGDAAGGGDNQATTIVEEGLQRLARAVASQTRSAGGQLVIAVPALYSAARRAALRDLALSVGFADVHLLNDAMAAVIGFTRGSQEPLTALVYSLGYSGYEIGVIRVARGRYRAVAYDGGSSVGGARFDMLIMRGCLQALAAQGHWSPSNLMPADTWLQFRQLAQHKKERLQEDDHVSLRLNVTSTSTPPPPLEISRGEFDALVTNAIGPSLEATERLLEDANLELDEIDELLLVGGSTHIKAIQSAVAERFDRQPRPLPDDAIMIGAASYASQLRLIPAADAPLVGSLDLASADESAATLPVLKVTLSSEEEEQDPGDDNLLANLGQAGDRDPGSSDGFDLTLDVEAPRRPTAVSSRATESVVEAREQLFQHVRDIVQQGAVDRARGVLQGVIQDAQAMLSMLPAPAAAGRQSENTRKVLERAREMLAEGRYQQAVEHSHIALSLDQENPDVFEAMVDIHCQAAAAHASVEGYKKSIEWLMCAHGHDRSNSEIQDRIADRHFLHAQAMAEAGDNDEANKALEECLYFNPQHQEAEALRAQLSASIS